MGLRSHDRPSSNFISCAWWSRSEVSAMGDRRKCQTYTASPAEPGGLPVMLASIYTACGRRTATDGHVTFCEEEVPFIIDSKKGRRVEGLDPESAEPFFKNH